jgi:OmpA-OmpF porin, OOP family
MPSILSALFTTLDRRSVGGVASRLGVTEGAVTEGLETSSATLLSGLASKTGNPTWLNEFFNFVSAAPANVNFSDLANAAIDPSRASTATASVLDSGKKFLAFAFGGDKSSMFDEVAKSTGLRPGIISSLMSMAAPLMMTALGRLVRDDHMSPAGLGRLLTNEAQDVREFLPPGVSTLLNGTPSTSMSGTPASAGAIDDRPVAIGTIPEPHPRSRAWWWIIPLVLVGLLSALFYRTRHPVIPVVRVIRPAVVVQIPHQVLLRISHDPAAARLLAFIQDPTKGAHQSPRFDFNRILFGTNSAALQPGSQAESENIAAILKAYPNVHLMIGGHTDRTGSALQNLRLSQARADAVKAKLAALGISPDRLDTKGYGAQMPVANDSTAAGRALNRRISFTVTQK